MWDTFMVNLVIPFIALVLLSVMIDRFTLFSEGVMHRIPVLPDKFEWWVAYAIILISSYFVCWQLDFSMFSYLGLNARTPHVDWGLTALIVSGGSSFVRSQFDMMNQIPSFLTGITTMVKRRKIEEPIQEEVKHVEEVIHSTEGTPSIEPVAPVTYPEPTPSIEYEYSEGEYAGQPEQEEVKEEVNYNDSSRFSENI